MPPIYSKKSLFAVFEMFTSLPHIYERVLYWFEHQFWKINLCCCIFRFETRKLYFEICSYQVACSDPQKQVANKKCDHFIQSGILYIRNHNYGVKVGSYAQNMANFYRKIVKNLKNWFFFQNSKMEITHPKIMFWGQKSPQTCQKIISRDSIYRFLIFQSFSKWRPFKSAKMSKIMKKWLFDTNITNFQFANCPNI